VFYDYEFEFRYSYPVNMKVDAAKFKNSNDLYFGPNKVPSKRMARI